MPLKVNLAIQISLVLINGAQSFLPLFSTNTKMIVGVALGMCNSVVGVIAHFFNTDGNPQGSAVPETK